MFLREVNHTISNNIVSLPYDVFSLEALNPGYMRENGLNKTSRRNIGSWSPSELQKFMEYKAEDVGKIVLYVNPKHTSQKCSKCGYVDKNNRHGSVFKCINCGFKLNAYLNASRNI